MVDNQIPAIVFWVIFFVFAINTYFNLYKLKKERLIKEDNLYQKIFGK